MQHRVKVQVTKAKQRAYDARLDTKEGESDLDRLAIQRDRDGKEVQQAYVIKNRDGNVLTDAGSLTGRWKDYSEELMNEENEGEQRVEEMTCGRGGGKG